MSAWPDLSYLISTDQYLFIISVSKKNNSMIFSYSMKTLFNLYNDKNINVNLSLA